MRLLLTAFFLEVGFVLTVVPWSPYWERNYFAESLPLLETLVTNDFVRGAVTGLGVVNIAAGLYELFAIVTARRIQSPTIISLRHPSEEQSAFAEASADKS